MEARNLDPRTTATAPIEGQLELLEQASRSALQRLWAEAFGAQPPDDLSAALLRLALAWRLQAQAGGGLSEETRSRLLDLQFGLSLNPAYRLTPLGDLTPGTVLTRGWAGDKHTVYVLDDRFAWEGRTYRSLTAVARAITGKHWPGPAFFGLYKPRQQVGAAP